MAAFRAFRSHDFEYDPLFVVSGPKDHFKAALLAKMATAKFQVCPVFASMFSDLRNYPRNQLVRRKSAPATRPSIRSYSVTHPPESITSGFHRKPDVVGFDRAKYFDIPKRNLVLNVAQEVIFKPELKKPKSAVICKQPQKNTKNKKMQTQYREESAQTIPWQPSFVVTDNSDPEILKLDFLKWDNGLPAGRHEVTLIERARMKRLWEQKCDIKNEEDLIRQRNIVVAIERDEWAFREQEIQDIQDLRMKLLEQMLNELHEKSNARSQMKLKMFAEMKHAEKEEKLRKIAHKTKRELRKLDRKHTGVSLKYRPVNITDEHVHRDSEIYAPLMRNGVHPKRWHQVIDDKLNRYKEQFIGIEEFSTLPSWLERATQMKDCCCLKMKGTRLCMRETKWTTPVLKKLHEELKAFRKTYTRRYSLLQRVVSPPSHCSTPEVECIPDEDEDFYQAIVLIQSLIKGRAAQMHIYEGRERCRELIEELKHTSGLLDDENMHIYDDRLNIKMAHRIDQLEKDKVYRVQEKLDQLQGALAGTLLDFLNKELHRLLEERRAHAICILLERERHDREAAEAGRRQLELRRRREHDEMFRQVVKVKQETVDLYLEDIIREGIDFASDEEAKQYIKRLAQKIDDEAYQIYTKVNEYSFENEEQIANMVHHFVLPEVEKQLVREKLRAKQKEKLRAVHETVYEELDNVYIPEKEEEENK